jgi:protein phosphatase
MFAAGRTHIGKVRSQNQDSIFLTTKPIGPLPNLFIVADGMGGHNGGEVASGEGVDYFCEYLRQQPPCDAINAGYLDLLFAAADAANGYVFGKSQCDPALDGMGTTFTSCVVYDGKCEIVHIGDSRLYMITKKRIAQLTTDHTYVNEMVKAGQLTKSQAREHPKRNVLTRVLGVGAKMAADGSVRALEPDCVLLLCSDGLTNMLSDETLHAAALSPFTAEDRVDAMINQANDNGGSDNISLILIDTTAAPRHI